MEEINVNKCIKLLEFEVNVGKLNIPICSDAYLYLSRYESLELRLAKIRFFRRISKMSSINFFLSNASFDEIFNGINNFYELEEDKNYNSIMLIRENKNFFSVSLAILPSMLYINQNPDGSIKSASELFIKRTEKYPFDFIFEKDENGQDKYNWREFLYGKRS